MLKEKLTFPKYNPPCLFKSIPVESSMLHDANNNPLTLFVVLLELEKSATIGDEVNQKIRVVRVLFFWPRNPQKTLKIGIDFIGILSKMMKIVFEIHKIGK